LFIKKSCGEQKLITAFFNLILIYQYCRASSAGLENLCPWFSHISYKKTVPVRTRFFIQRYLDCDLAVVLNLVNLETQKQAMLVPPGKYSVLSVKNNNPHLSVS